jgi:hypothetical protein
MSYNSQMIKNFVGAANQTTATYNDAVKNSSVISALKSIGYKYDLVGNWYDTSNTSPLADQVDQSEGQLTILGHQITLSDFEKNEFLESDLYPFFSNGFSIGSHSLYSYSTINQQDQTLSQIQILNQLASQPSGGRFIFAHILVPHDPYTFNADGSINVNSGDDNVGEPIKTKYVNQIEFINSQMETLVSEINKNSNGKAIIILQSDEGPYPMEMNDGNYDISSVGDELSSGNMLNWSANDLKMKFGVLNAYHVPEASTSALAAGGSSLNIFRLVLNTYFGTSYSYLPECYYAYPNGRNQPFVYDNINSVLVGEKNSACPNNAEF